MAYREKLSWVMLVIMMLAGFWYFDRIDLFTTPAGSTPAPNMPILIGYVIFVVIASIIASIITTGPNPSEAGVPADEREKRYVDKAGHWSGYTMAGVALFGLGDFGINGDGNRLFHIIFGSLMASQIAEYFFLIVLYRRGH